MRQLADERYRSVYLNSGQKSYGSNNRPIFVLNPEIESTNKLKLLSVNLPLSYYNFQNVSFNWVESLNPKSLILNGNFTYTSLVSTLQSGLNQNSAVGNWTVTLNKYTNKLTINCPSLTFTVSKNNMLGFRTPSTVPSNTQTADSVLQLSKQYIVIRSNELTSNIATASRSYFNTLSNSNIVSVIPIISGAGQYHYFELPSSIEYLTSNGSPLETLSFYIEDSDGNSVDLNGIPFQIKLGIVSI